MILRKCLYCKVPGHTIYSCTSPDIRPIIRTHERQLEHVYTRRYIMQLLQRVPLIELRLLARDKEIRVEIQKGFLVEQLTDFYYKQNLQKRISELNQIFRLHITTPVSDIDFTDEFNIQHAILSYIRTLPTTEEATNEIIQKLNLFYTSIHYANIEQNFRYNIFIDAIYNAVHNIIDYSFEIPHNHSNNPARQWTITPFLLITSPKNVNGLHTCPICLDAFPRKDTINTNCNHLFCETCFCSFLQKCSFKTTPSCPLCREHIERVETISMSIYDKYEKKTFLL